MSDEDGWIAWTGGDCPTEFDALVEVRYARPAEQPGQRIEFPWTAGRFAWFHDGADDDIVAYKVLVP